MRNFPMALLLGIGLLSGLLQGCGGTPYHELSTNAPHADNTPSGSGNSTSGNGGGGFSFNPNGSSGSSNNSNLLPPITTSFSITGNGGSNPSYSFNVDTDNILKVKISAAAGGQISIPGYSNFTASYNCIGYKVSVLGQTVVTKFLAVNGGSSSCSGAPSDQTIDFSSRLTPGHNTVTVTVTTNGYDFYCNMCNMEPWLYNPYGFGCAQYCPMYGVYKTHTINGNLSVQVNGTNSP